MKLGLWLTARFGRGATFEQHFRDMRDQVLAGRDGGFGMIASGQHYLGPRLQTFPLLARLAADAGEMELLTAVVLLPLQNPVDLAEQAATMNAMVDGRFILGLGLGHQADEQVAFGVSRDSVADRFEEALAVMERLWDGEGQEFHGQYYDLPKLDLAWPIPYARPRIWIGGSGQRALRRARTHDFPWFPSELDLEGVVEGYRTQPPADPNAARPVGLWVHIAETDDEALADAARFGQVDPARPNYPVSIIGSPDTVLRRIGEYQERLGATHIIARVQPPGMGQAESMRRIQLLAERVIPELS